MVELKLWGIIVPHCSAHALTLIFLFLYIHSSFFFSRNIQLFNFPSKERPWPSSTLSKQLSNVESSPTDTITDNIEHYNSYQRSLSIDNSTVGELLLRSNRAVSVEPNLIAGGNDMKMNNGHHRHYLLQQKTLPTGSKNQYESAVTMNRQFTSSETIDQLK